MVLVYAEIDVVQVARTSVQTIGDDADRTTQPLEGTSHYWIRTAENHCKRPYFAHKIIIPNT